METHYPHRWRHVQSVDIIDQTPAELCIFNIQGFVQVTKLANVPVTQFVDKKHPDVQRDKDVSFSGPRARISLKWAVSHVSCAAAGNK